MKLIRFFLLACAVWLIAAPASAQDTAIQRERPPTCGAVNAGATQPTAYYNAADGLWHCTSVIRNELPPKQLTPVTNNTATTVLTVQVPNTKANAVLSLLVQGIVGPGGTNGEGECTITLTGRIAITRNGGATAVAVASSAATTAVACITGGGTDPTLAYAVTSVTGGATATQQFTVTVTLNSPESANNHTLLVFPTIYGSSAITVQ